MSTRQLSERPSPPSAQRQRLVTDATRQWTDQLMDVSGRNQLLFYRDLKVGTLDLGDADPSALDALLRGRKSSITRLFDSAGVPDRLKRARAIRNKSVESLEERGIVTCFLTSGMATWQPQQGEADAERARALASSDLHGDRCR